MKVYPIALTLLKREYRKNISLGIILFFTILISFIFTNIGNDPILIDGDITQGYGTWDSIILPLSKGLPFVIICICWLMILYTINYYLNKKTQEFALLFVCGLNSFDIMKYVLLQVSLILCIVFPIALFIGVIVLKFISLSIYQYLNILDVDFTISKSTYIATIVAVISIFIWIAIAVGGYLHRNTIQDFINQSFNKNTIKMKVMTSKNIIFIFIYLIGILIMLFQEYYIYGFIFPTLISLLGILGIIKSTIPYRVQKWKRKRIDKKYALIYMSYYNNSLQGVTFLIMSMMVLITGIIPVLISQDMNTNEYITGALCYFIIVILLSICIVFKISISIQTRSNDFLSLLKVGYIRNELKKIIKNEIKVLYITIICLPLPIVMIAGIKYIIYENMAVQFFIKLLLLYIIPIILSAFITYYIYIREVIIQGVKYEK